MAEIHFHMGPDQAGSVFIHAQLAARLVEDLVQ
jgi:hypothetical protein